MRFPRTKLIIEGRKEFAEANAGEQNPSRRRLCRRGSALDFKTHV